MPGIEAISLYDLNRMLKDVIYQGFPSAIWIVAEISQINENRSGHCYLELIEKDQNDDSIKASSRATIWASRYRMIQPYFETTTGQSLTEGIKVMVSVKLDYHERYGFSLNIIDIEPSFTLGELARRRLDIIRKLEEAGVINMNKELELTQVPQRIAVISSDSAAGYGDFIDQINNNTPGYHFYIKLYQASMQGSDTGVSIINALDKISEAESFFDAVVIIRGGGAKTDLSSFDDFDLAYYVSQFPLPVIAGIGHERDESVVDMVAHTSCKTPTAVAEFIIQEVDYFVASLDEMKSEIVETARQQLADWKEQLVVNLQSMKTAGENLLRNELMSLRETALRGSSATSRYVHIQQTKLNTIKHNAGALSTRYLEGKRKDTSDKLLSSKGFTSNLLTEKRNTLALFQKEVDLQDPYRILKKGYSITLINGKIIKDPKDIKPGDEISSRLSSGSIESKVIKANSTKK